MLDIRDYEAMVKLDLPDGERAQLSEQAETLIRSFLPLNEIITEEVQPITTVLDLQNILREDISQKLLTREEILKNAPEQYDGYFQVPGTLE